LLWLYQNGGKGLWKQEKPDGNLVCYDCAAFWRFHSVAASNSDFYTSSLLVSG
jgi:hypothetical protein